MIGGARVRVLNTNTPRPPLPPSLRKSGVRVGLAFRLPNDEPKLRPPSNVLRLSMGAARFRNAPPFTHITKSQLMKKGTPNIGFVGELQYSNDENEEIRKQK